MLDNDFFQIFLRVRHWENEDGWKTSEKDENKRSWLKETNQ